MDTSDRIATVADGGAGPCYGLLPLLDPVDAKVDLRADFPFSIDNPCPNPDPNDRHYHRGERERWRQIKKGTKTICDEGACFNDLLVLRGPAVGTVWWLAGVVPAVYPLVDPETGGPLTFLRWYELWLDSALKDPGLTGSSSRFIPPDHRLGFE